MLVRILNLHLEELEEVSNFDVRRIRSPVVGKFEQTVVQFRGGDLIVRLRRLLFLRRLNLLLFFWSGVLVFVVGVIFFRFGLLRLILRVGLEVVLDPLG